jgi:hypothetical protein
MSRAITMIFIGVVKAVTSAEEQTTDCKQDSQDWQNYFEIEHVLMGLDKITLICIF